MTNTSDTRIPIFRQVTASHPVWKLARHRTRVSVKGDNGDVGTRLAVAGFDISGTVGSGVGRGWWGEVYVSEVLQNGASDTIVLWIQWGKAVV